MDQEQALRTWSDTIFNYLLEYLKAHPEFRFLPRKNNDKHGRLQNGHWFQGSDYINVSLVKRSGGNHSTKQIGFEVSLKDPARPHCYLIFVYKNEPDPAVLNFYETLENRFQEFGIERWGPNILGLPYADVPVLNALEICLTWHLPEINRLINIHGVEEQLFISQKSMQNKIDRILQIRESMDALQYPDAGRYEGESNQVSLSNKRGRALEQEEMPPFKPSAPSEGGGEHIIRQMEAKMLELPDTHRKIMLGLHRYLSDRYTKNKVAAERSPRSDNSRVDIALQTEDGEVFYEVKTYTSLRHCIRIALGQLFEYCFYPGNQRAQKLVIVSQHEPDDDTVEYMQYLRKRLGVQLYYAGFNLETGTLGDEV